MLGVQYVYKKLSEEQKKKLRKRLEKKLARIRRFFTGLEEEVLLQVTVDLVGERGYEVGMRISELSLVVKRQGKSLWRVLEVTFDDFKEKLLRRLEMMKEPVWARRRRGQLEELVEAKRRADEAQELDYSSLKPWLNPLRRYIVRSLRTRRLRRKKALVEVTADEVLGEVLLLAFERKAPGDSGLTLEEWMYQLANEVVDRKLAELERESELRSVEEIKQMELEQLREIVTADADGELVLVDELESDVAYHYQELDLPQEDVDYLEQLSRQEEVAAVTRAMAALKDEERRVVELAVFEQYPVGRVGAILGWPKAKVEKVLAQAKKKLAGQLREGK